MKTNYLLLSLLAWVGTGLFCRAQQTIVTFISPTEGGPAPDSADYSVGFELDPTNTVWWWTGFSQGGEIPFDCEFGNSYAGTSSVPNMLVEDQNYLITGTAHDTYYFNNYFFADDRSGQLYYGELWGGTNYAPVEVSTPYTPPPSGYHMGTMMNWNNNIYWSDYNGTYFDIMSFVADSFTETQYVRGGTGNKIIKMVGFTYNTSTFTYADAIFALTADGQLLRMDINPQAATVVLATNVTDFAIRDESQHVFPFGFDFYTTIYAATGQKNNLSSTTPPGTLVAINAETGASNTIYTASGQNQITSVTTDTTNIYWTEQPVTCNPPFGCLLGDYSIYRQSRPADHSSSPGTIDLIGEPGGGAGVNLRTDGYWLYFLNGTSIKRISTGTPAVQVDVQADGLEVVQAIQNLDSQVPLVANHATCVRGYAHMSSSDTNKTYFSTALLHGFRNGVEFPDSPIYPVRNVPLLNGTVSVAQLRGDTQHSFLFQLPASWVQSGPDLPTSLTFTMTANPDLEIPETPSQPLNNNTVSLLQPVVLQHGLTPSLITVPLVTKEGSIYYHYSPGFQQTFQRVLSLLPVEKLDVYPYLVLDPIGDWNNPWDFANTNFSTSEDAWNGALSTMNNLYFWSDLVDPISDDEHIAGMVHPAAVNLNGGIAGIGDRPGNGVVLTMGGMGFGFDGFGSCGLSVTTAFCARSVDSALRPKTEPLKNAFLWLST